MAFINSLSDNPFFESAGLSPVFDESPLGFIDVGARGGTHELLEPLARQTAVLAFEPDQEECNRMQALAEVTEPWADFNLEPVALAESERDAELHLLSAPTNHSLLPPNPAITHRYKMDKWVEVGCTKLMTKSLDEVLYKHYPDKTKLGEFIKLDTQGTEFEILSGATKMLSERTVAIVVEVAFAELYKGQKLFSEVEILLRQYGFSFYGFSSSYHRSQKLLDKNNHLTKERAFYADAVFFKDPLSGEPSAQLDTRQCQALTCCALLLGYIDFALELAQQTWLINADPEQRQNMHHLVSSLAFADPAVAKESVVALMKLVDEEPDKSNIHVGGFVDKRRQHCDYHDVFNTLATPKPKQ